MSIAIHPTKWRHAMEVYTGHTGATTVGIILAEIGEDVIASVSGKVLGSLMNSVNRSYHNGLARLHETPED
jgi:hypothetical protein